MTSRASCEELERRIQELEKAESELSLAKDRFKKIFDNAQDAIFIHDLEGKILDVNDKMCRMYGLTKEEALEVTIEDVSSSKMSMEVLLERWQKVLNDEKLFFEWEALKPKDKSVFNVEVSIQKISFHDKDIVLANVRDITERRRMENENLALANIIKRSQDFIGVADMKGNPFFVNPAGQALVGLNGDEAVKCTTIKDYFTEEDLQFFEETILPTLMAEGRWQGEYRFCHFKTGAPIPLLYDLFLTENPETGQVTNISTISRDITERKRAEEALRESLTRYDELVANVPVGVYVFWVRANGHLEFEYVSNRWCEIHQLKREDVLADATRANNQVHPDDRDDFLACNQESFRNRIPFSWEGRFLIGDGQLRWLRIESTPLVFDNGDIRWFGLTSDITERMQAEEQLRKSEEQFRNLYNEAPVGYFEYDLQGNITRVNHTYSKMLGYIAEEMIGQPCWKFIVDEVAREQIMAKLDGVRPPAVGLERTYRRKDGTTFPVLFEDRLLLDEDGHIKGIRTAIQDLTARKRAETYREMGREILQILNESGDLHESIQRVLTVLKTGTGLDAVGLRLQEGEDFPYFVQDGFPTDFLLTENTLIERGKDGGVCRDKDGNVRLECTCGLVISGKTVPSNPLFTKGGSSWTNDSFSLVDLPSDQDPRLYPRNNCIHQGYASVALIPIRTSDRIVGLIQLNDRRKGRFTLEMIEILEVIAVHVGSALIRKQMEEDLEKSLSLIEATMNSLEEGLLVVDMEGKVIRHNRAFLDLWKISPDLESSSDEMLLDHVASQPVDPVAFLSKVRQLYDTPEVSSFDEIAFVDGRVFERYSRPQWQGSQITGRVWCFRDITKRKQAEEEREKLQTQLNQAQKMESVGRLAGGVAHDFNNMLSVILGHTEMVLEETDPASPLYADLHSVHQAGERSAALTRQLLAFARKQTVAPEVIDINDTVEGMLNMLRRLIGEDINLLWQPGRSLQPVKVDPSQIDQLLANLCVNARDAIGGVGKVTIETEIKTFDEDYCHDHLGSLPGEYVLLEVSDNGCGMDKKTLNHIFEPFFTTKEQGKGTGLGLASIYGIVKQNNGFINVYSEPDQGTTFKIYLPVYAIKSGGVVEKDPDLAVEHGNETILLVEDESAILEMTTRMLEKLGYTVVAAATPGEAIRLAHEYQGRIDLLMTDVVMPEMNGRELAGNLLSHYPDLKRLFMSGYTANVIAHHGVLDEGVHFIQKPFSKKDLGGKVREVLED